MLKHYGKITLLTTLLASGFYAQIATATDHTDLNNDFMAVIRSSFVMSLSAGASWENAGQAQTLNLAPNITKTYTADKPETTLAQGELFLGLQKTLSAHSQGQLGLAFVSTDNAKLSGNIWDDADPSFDNYTYQYHVQHSHIALKGKFIGDWNLPVLPWISASIGIGFNKAHDFTNTPTDYQAVATPNFASHTTTAFTYTLGVGAQRALTKNWQVGVGFEFADWGKSQLGSAPGETTGENISLSHLYTQSILFNLTYLA